jgi:glycosyltransferase involved in cell wall biosynthesis
MCVVPSILYESFSYTCAQAMAAGRPVVATRIGGIPETVEDGVTGLLVEPGNAAELAEALIRLALDPVQRARMGQAGRERVARDFNPATVARRMLAVYARAAAKCSGLS